MRRSKNKHTRRNGSRGLTFLTILCAGGLGCLLAGWNASSRVTELSPSETVALRFPDPRNDIFNDIAEARAEAVPSDEMDQQSLALFNPNPTIPVRPVTPVAPAYVTASLASTPVELEPAPAMPHQAAPARESRAKVDPKADVKTQQKTEFKIAAVRKPAPSRRPGAVLSDGQIASIKTRLNLTADQQQMWPAVEHALRNLSYSHNPGARDGGRGATRTATVDPSSDEVQRLKSAAFPLIMSFSDEQKRELRILAHVAGLEKLAAQF